MARSAKALMAILAVAPGIYISMTVALAIMGKLGFVPRIPFLFIFLGLLAVSVLDGGLLVFIQTSTKVMSSMGRYDPVARVYHIATLGSILSEAFSIFGIILTLFSGSLAFIAGFSAVTWIGILWVRSKFNQNLGRLPNP